MVGKDSWELYDAEARYVMRKGFGPAGMVEITTHDLGDCPVVLIQSQYDLLGMPMGEVEPVMSDQDRITDATFNLSMVSKYGAFPQRWIAGMKVAKDAEGNTIPPDIRAYVDHILVAGNADTKFGQFAAADQRGYVEALEAHIRHLAAHTQTPPHYLLGSLVNLSAEALAAAESGLQRKIKDRQEVIGEGLEQWIRMAALAAGDEVSANDTKSQVHWQDVESRSLSQVSDAVVKLAGAGVPLEMLLEMIPGWSKTDVDRAMDLIRQAGGDSIDRLLSELMAGQASPELDAVE
jgi:hypothetical protein